MKNWIKNNKIILIVFCLMLSLIVVISVSYAAFMGTGYKKGVVSTTPVGVKFSSNYLELISSESSNIGEYEVSLPESDVILFNLDIMNVAKEDPFNPNEYNITYDLQIKIEHNQGETLNGPFTINDNPLDVNSNDFQTIPSQRLEAGKVNTKKYQIKIPNAEVRDVKITIKAIPNSEDGSMNALGNKMLARVFTFSTYIAGESSDFLWKGKILEGVDSEKSSALNYELSGFGEGRVKLSWNKDNFVIDPFFLEELKLIVGSERIDNVEKSFITIDVDSDTTDYYKIQFYRIAPIQDDEETTFSIETEETEKQE